MGRLAYQSNPTHEEQDDKDDQDDTDDTYSAVTESVAVAAETATEAAKQEDDEQNDEYESNRHCLSPVMPRNRKRPFAGLGQSIEVRSDRLFGMIDLVQR